MNGATRANAAPEELGQLVVGSHGHRGGHQHQRGNLRAARTTWHNNKHNSMYTQTRYSRFG